MTSVVDQNCRFAVLLRACYSRRGVNIRKNYHAFKLKKNQFEINVYNYEAFLKDNVIKKLGYGTFVTRFIKPIQQKLCATI